MTIKQIVQKTWKPALAIVACVGGAVALALAGDAINTKYKETIAPENDPFKDKDQG